MKTIKLLAMYCLSMCLFIACGTNVSTKDLSVTGSDGKTYTSYRTACSNGDFDAAREYVEKMKEQLAVVKAEGDYNEKEALSDLIKEAEDYIENEEVQYLASLNEEQTNNRIILILNQRPIEGLEAAEKACLGKNVYKHDLDMEVSRLSNDSPEEVKNFKRYITWCGNHNSRCSSVLSIAIACGNQSLAQKIVHCFRPDPEMQLVHCLPAKDENYEYYFDVYAHYTKTSIDAAQKKYDEAVKSGAFDNK